MLFSQQNIVIIYKLLFDIYIYIYINLNAIFIDVISWCMISETSLPVDMIYSKE